MSHQILGIISGMGTRAGLLFVNKLMDRVYAPTDQDFPEFILHNNSGVPDRTLSIVYGEESPVAELSRSIKMLKSSGSDLIVSTCVTSYFFIDQLTPKLRSNILNPIDLIISELKRNYSHLKRIGLLATSGTVKSGVFQKRFESSPFDLVTLDSYEQEEKLMQSIYGEGGFKSSCIEHSAYDLFQEAVDALAYKEVDLIIGGCTETQIGFEKTTTSIQYLDVIDVLIDAVLEGMDLNDKRKVAQEVSNLSNTILYS